MINSNLDLVEEVFCLNLELNTLANVLLRNESERWIPSFLNTITEKSHLDRYNLAKQFVNSKKVIDIACGVGKGSFILADEGLASNVDAFDIDFDAIRYAKHRNNHRNIKFCKGDAEKIDIENEYDFAVSFETIEHLNNYSDFLINIKKALKIGGYFLVSTPISNLEYDDNPSNPFHVQEWGFKSFQELISKYFNIEKVYLQIYPSTLANYRRNRDYIKPSLLQRIIKKIIKEKDIKNHAEYELFSKLEEYSGQYSEDELKVQYIGYQIILARK